MSNKKKKESGKDPTETIVRWWDRTPPPLPFFCCVQDIFCATSSSMRSIVDMIRRPSPIFKYRHPLGEAFSEEENEEEEEKEAAPAFLLPSSSPPVRLRLFPSAPSCPASARRRIGT